jgi:hypothetical protein
MQHTNMGEYPQTLRPPIEAKTTNLNLRLTPTRKVELVRESTRLGLTQSEYAEFLMEQGHCNLVSEKANKLLEQKLLEAEQKLAGAANKLAAYESALLPHFQKLNGDQLQVGSDWYAVSDQLTLLKIILKHFKLK